MFRKFLKRSIPFLVAALVLIGTVVVPAQAAYYIPSEDNPSLEYEPYHSFLKFDIQAYDENGNLLGFSMPSTISHAQDNTRSDVWLYPELGFIDNYRMRLFHEKSSHSHLISSSSDNGTYAYYNHDLSFDKSSSMSYTDADMFYPVDITFRFEDFVLMLDDVNWGSAFFLCHIPEGWCYTLSYDYYYVTEITYDIYYTKNVISDKQSNFMSGKATSDMTRSLIRDYDYDYMMDNGAVASSYVLITNAYFSLFAPADVDPSAAHHSFKLGYAKANAGYPLSSFYEWNELDFSEDVYIEKIVEVPVFDVGITNFLTTGVGGFLDADIFGTFSIGDLLSILISVFFIVYLLRLLK